MASAIDIGAFNLGKAIGGLVINSGLGHPAISLASAAIMGWGLLMMLGLLDVLEVVQRQQCDDCKGERVSSIKVRPSYLGMAVSAL